MECDHDLEETLLIKVTSLMLKSPRGFDKNTECMFLAFVKLILLLQNTFQSISHAACVQQCTLSSVALSVSVH